MTSPKISLIAVMSDDRVIAKNGKIPWHLPADVKAYRDAIRGRVIIAGRKTFDKTYPENVVIVVTTQIDYVPPAPATVVHSINEALTLAKSEEILKRVQADKRDEIFVIGGGEVFKETIEIADKLYLTIIHKKIDGDTYFPDYSQFKKIVYDKEEESDGYSYRFLDLER